MGVRPVRPARAAEGANLPEGNRALRKPGEQPMPYRLVVIDELADPDEGRAAGGRGRIIRLAHKSRAVGNPPRPGDASAVVVRVITMIKTTSRADRVPPSRARPTRA